MRILWYNSIMKRFKLISAACIISAFCLTSGCAQSETYTEPQNNEVNKTLPVAENRQTEEPEVSYTRCFAVTGDSVKIRSGAGTDFSVRGTAEKNTLYSLCGICGDWYETYYKGKKSYISAKYCKEVNFLSESDDIEKVISEGTKLLGVKYVYGAVRLHDGKGNLNKNFTITEFDCSSYMQYMFYKGANEILDVTTRTQVKQGRQIDYSSIKRGDLLFFTNASRINNSGIERIGHVGLYLGDGYMLHTASDYSKIEKLTESRKANFICARRIL